MAWVPSRSEQDAPRLGEIGDPLGGIPPISPVVGVSVAQQMAKLVLQGRPAGHLTEVEDPQRPLDRILPTGVGSGVAPLPTREMAHEAPVEGTRPAHALTDAIHHLTPRSHRQLSRRVDRRQNVLSGRPILGKLEFEVFAAPDQLMDTAGEAHAVLLEPEPQTGLRDPHPLLQLQGQTVEVVEEVGVEEGNEVGHDPRQKHPAEAGGGNDGKILPPERHAARRRDGTRMEDL